MCGIVGYIGNKNAAKIIISGLHRLEYRGYDSAGIATFDKTGAIQVCKTAGKISVLEKAINMEIEDPYNDKFNIGIGHTRWATHGAPNKANAHPHLSQNGKFAVVHNGIIDNYDELKKKLISKGYKFKSETDTEVIAHLIEDNYKGNLKNAVTSTLEILNGTYGITVISSLHPGTIIAARKGSPIAIGICDDETIIASDISAIINHTKQVIFLNDGDIAVASALNVDITSIQNVPVSRETTQIDWDITHIEKGSAEHFMIKEIREQPAALSNTIRGRLIHEEGTSKLGGLQMDPRDMAQIDRIAIAGCGTSYYAGMVGKYFFEDFAEMPTEVQQSAEFRDRNPMIQRNTCLIAISQSGETADTLHALREAKRKGAMVFAISNVVGSTIAREAERGVYLHAGPEIGVASTKAFSCQVSVLAMLALAFARLKRLSTNKGKEIVDCIASFPKYAEQIIGQEEKIKKIASKYFKAGNFFFIGRGYMFPAALEGALKLKEISYIHAEGYHASELKHGPIALLDENVPVVVAAPNSATRTKTISNMQECKARKSPVIAIISEGDKEIANNADDVIEIPLCPEFASPIPVVIAEQLFAYHIAKLRGCPIDQPRNLAKSVTVE